MNGAGKGSGPTVLAFDVGLTNAKAVLFDVDGMMMDRASIPYPTVRPSPDRAEQDPEAWLAALAKATAEIAGRSAEGLRQVAAVSVTAHMHALVGMDADARATGPALVLGDRRATLQADRITRDLGAREIYGITGAELDASMPAAKIAWLREMSPAVAGRTRTWTSCKDYIRHQLTGDVRTDPIDACATSLYDIRAGRWSEPMLAEVGIDEGSLPVLAAPDEVAGPLLAGPAGILGLRPGTPVVVGGGDDVEVLGNGLLGPGESLEHLGTTGSILTVSERYTPDPEMRLEIYPHAIGGLWVLGGSMTAAGAAIATARSILRAGPEEAASALAVALEAGDDDPVFLPDIAGQRVPVRAPHARGGWVGITPATRRDALVAAVYRGVAFGLRRILVRAEELVGPQRLITVSGDNTDAAWLQLRADVYDRPLAPLETSEPTALGAAILALAGIGIHADVAVAVRATARRSDRIQPDATAAARLRDEYARFVRVSDALLAVWADPEP